MTIAIQSELPLDPTAEPWQRMLREPPAAYAAFAVYRDFGSVRTVSAAYRKWHAERESKELQPPLIATVSLAQPSAGEYSPPASWKKWRKQWQWDERVAAFDQANETAQRSADQLLLEARRRKRFEQLLALDEVHFGRIMKINGLVDDLLRADLTKIRQSQSFSDNKSQVIEFDKLAAFDTLSERLGELEEKYFSGLEDKGDGDAGGVQEVVGEFAWVADPAAAVAAAAMAAAAEGEAGK